MEKSKHSLNLSVVTILIYNLCLVAGTAWLVAVYDWSPWWFLLTILFMANYEKMADYEKTTYKNEK